MTSVVAVVCSYWPNRRPQVQRIVDDLRNGSVVPDRVLVVNNHTDAISIDGAEMVHVPWNSHCRGKFIAGLLIAAPYYLFLDDDTSVGRTTLETLLAHARPDTCTGYLGCWTNGAGSIHTGARLWPKDAEVETPCETFCGCAMFCSFQALVNMLALEAKVRLDGKWPTEGDDLLLGLANKSTVVPLRGEACFVDLGYAEQAMCYSIEDYYGMRDRFLMDVLPHLGRKG